MWQYCQRTPCERKTKVVLHSGALGEEEERKAECYPSPDLPQTRQALLLLLPPARTCSCCWRLLLHHNLLLEPGAAGAWTPGGLVGGIDYLCLNVTFHLANVITIGSLKEQEDETVQKYKQKVLKREKCQRQVKLNANRVLAGCWWGCSYVFAFV